jgi:hypothetical protein
LPTHQVRVLAGLVVALACGLAAPAHGHEFWLAPSTYRPRAGDPVQVRAFVGTGFRGELRPFTPRRTLRFSWRGAEELDLRAAGVNGEPVWADRTWGAAGDSGGVIISYESDFVPIELPAAEFDRYLALEGLDEVLAIRRRLGALAGPGRERYRRVCKTWLAGDDPARAGAPVGLPLEIVPLADPARPGPLRVRVLAGRRPLAGALVRAWRQDLERGAVPAFAATRDSVGPAAEGRTDAAGEVTLALRGDGEWLLSCVHMAGSADLDEADWESTWASFTFARVAIPARRRGR